MNIADITRDDFKSLVSEAEKLANSLKGNLPDIIKKASESAERYEYTSVDCNLPGGWYNPDFYQFLTVSGWHRGKIKKSKNKPQKYGYEYGVDKNGRLTYDHYFESMSYGIYIYSREAVYRVACMYENNEAFALLCSVSKWSFEGGKIKESANIDMLPDGEVSTVEKIRYCYQNRNVTIGRYFYFNNIKNKYLSKSTKITKKLKISDFSSEYYVLLSDENGAFTHYTTQGGFTNDVLYRGFTLNDASYFPL